MQFIKDFFKHDKVIIGLSGIRKEIEYIKITVPERYKQVSLTNTEKNYLLF